MTRRSILTLFGMAPALRIPMAGRPPGNDDKRIIVTLRNGNRIFTNDDNLQLRQRQNAIVDRTFSSHGMNGEVAPISSRDYRIPFQFSIHQKEKS